MRLFVAADLPEALKAAVEEQVVEPLRARLPAARWTRPEGRHLTLKFLGPVEDDRVAPIGRALAAAAAVHAPFESGLENLGAFPSLRRPRVLWLGLGHGKAAMAALAADVERLLEPEGFQPEGRPFNVHLTLARFKDPRPVGPLPAVAVPVERFPVGEVVLFASELRRDGARYTAVERFRLAGH